MTKNLYRVTCKGMTYGRNAHGIAYVVAEDAEEAYRIVRRDLEQRKLGMDHDRALEKVELIAENCPYPPSGTRLYA